MVKISRLLHQASESRGVFRFHQVEQTSHFYYYSRCFGGVSQSFYLFRTELQLNASLLQRIELSDVFKELTCVHVTLYLGGVLELCSHVGHAADVVDIKRFIVKVQVYIVAIRLEARSSLPSSISFCALRPRGPSS